MTFLSRQAPVLTRLYATGSLLFAVVYKLMPSMQYNYRSYKKPTVGPANTKLLMTEVNHVTDVVYEFGWYLNTYRPGSTERRMQEVPWNPFSF